MRWLKIILIVTGVLAGVCIVVLSVALLTFDNDDYRRIATRAAAHFTGYAVTVDGPFSLQISSEPSLYARAIRLDAGPAGNPPPITAIGSLKIRIALWPLVTGLLVFKELRVEDVFMAIERGAKPEPGEQRGSFRKTLRGTRIPVFESVRLHNIRLDLIDPAADRIVEVRLRQFSFEDARDGGPLFLKGDGSIGGNTFVIEGRLGALAAIIEGKEPFPVAFDFQAAGFHVSLSGTVEDMVEGKGMALHLSGKTGDLAALLRMLNLPTPPLGDLKFRATVFRDAAVLGVSDLAVNLSGVDRIEFALAGAIDDLTSGAGTDIRFTAACADPGVLTWLLPANLPEIQHIRMQGAVRETEGVLAAEELAVRIDAAGGLSAGADGRIGLGKDFRTLSPTDLDLDIQLSMPTTELLRSYGVDRPPTVGPLEARGQLIGPPEVPALEDIFIEAGGTGPLRITARGRIGQLPIRPDTDSKVSQIDLNVALQADSTRALASGFGLNLPELGTVALNARIQGASERFRLTDIDARTDSAQGLQISLAGTVDFDLPPESGWTGKPDLRTTVVAPSAAVAMAPFGRADLPDLRPFRADGRIGGSFEALALDPVTVRAGQSGPLRFRIDGAVDRVPLDGRPPAGVKLETVIAADNTAVLSTMFGSTIPDFGPLRATARIRGRNRTYGVPRLRLVMGDEKGAGLTVTGQIATLLRPDGFSVEGIDLTAVARNFVLPALPGRLGRTLADLGPYNGRFQVAGHAEKLSISNADLTTLSPRGLRVEATGGIAGIRFTGDKPVEGMNLSLTASAPAWTALPAAAGLDLPDLGPLQATAKIYGGSGRGFDVEPFEILAGNAQQEVLHVQGQILRIGIRDQVTLDAVFETGSRPWAAHYLQRPEAMNVPLTGAIRATTDADGLRIDTFRLAAAGDERLSMEARGRIHHRREPTAAEMELEVRAPDPGIIGSMTGISLPKFAPLAIDGRIGGNAGKLQFSGEIHFGDTRFQSSINVDLTAQRPKVGAAFAADIVLLTDIGIFPAPPPEEMAVPAEKPTPPPAGMIFDDTPLELDALKTFDLVFSLDADTVVGQAVRIENLDLDITLQDGRLHVYPASVVYAAGFTEIGFTLDASGPVPVFELKITGEDIDVEDLLARAREPIVLSGELSLAADLRSAGRSRRELASNLAGAFNLAIENGRIRRIVNFLSTDAMNLVFATADRRQHTDLSCLVGGIRFQDGIGEIDFFFMDTPRVRARAAGNVNLASETIDIAIHPEQKRRLFRRQTSTVRIHGLLARPSFRTMPLEEAARLFGTILMPHVFISEQVLGSLWPLIRRDRNASPCVRALGTR